jgi:hypothetical protein
MKVVANKKKGMTKVIKHFTIIQRPGALAITSGLRTSPTDALDASTFLMPAALYINKWMHRAMVRLAMLPKEHPLHKLVASKRTRKVRRHKSPINQLLAKYSCDVQSMEKILAMVSNPTQKGKVPFQVRIVEDREMSMEEAKSANEKIQVYADGSAINGKVGATTVLIREGKTLRALHLHLGPESEHTVHEAELVGILLVHKLAVFCIAATGASSGGVCYMGAGDATVMVVMTVTGVLCFFWLRYHGCIILAYL